MKKFLVGAAATAAILAPTMASAESTGVIGFQYTSNEIDNFDWDGYGIEGAFAHSFGNGTYVQLDAASGRTDFSGVEFSTGYGALHYGIRNDSYAFGGFVSFDEYLYFSGLGIGLEGQYYLPNMVFNGTLANISFDEPIDENSTAVAVDASYFFSPNLSVTGALTLADDKLYGDDLTVWGIGGEYRFASNPISIELGYRQADVYDDDATAWTIGFNIDLGAESLYDRATNGASFNGAERLHDTLTIVPGIG
ncbi:MAG TPA: hypothetical protein VM915_00395 [Verrucomicrobiae bacterium]|nr:hypothetical protein [Verrucomicrobiae bacterium]